MNLLNCSDWFEILEPKTEKHIFLSSLSGKCQWNPPIKYEKLNEDQWLELYDFKSNHFYYYNSQSKLKTWVKPSTNNCVSVVRLQANKEKMKKTFVDRETQTSFEIRDGGRILLNVSNHNSESSDLQNDDGNIDNLSKISTNISTIDMNSGLSDTMSLSRKYIPRTNPNHTRHSSTLRLSQPIESYEYDFAETIEDIDTTPGYNSSSINNPLYSSSFSVDDIISPEFVRTLNQDLPDHAYENNNFPRNSVITAIKRNMSKNNEIWSRTLFNKSGNQLAGIMSWTSKSIPDALLATTPKQYRRKACDIFKQIQLYMGEEKDQMRQELLALTICRRGISAPAWANEIFMQICKQVTHNPNKESMFKGWELICICLMFFHPVSVEMQSCFKSFLEQYSRVNLQINTKTLNDNDFDSKSTLCARMSLKLLEMSNKATEITAEDIKEAKISYASPTIFYSSLDEVMDVQRRFYPDRRLPWIQVALTREILRCDGVRTLGILRVPSEVYKMDILVNAIEKAFKRDSVIDIDSLPSVNGCDPLLNKILDDLQLEHDPILLISVLKHWLRHFRLPLVSFDENVEFEDSLTLLATDHTKLLTKLSTLPEINNLVLKYLIYFLQILARPENVVFTNMPVENLATLMAPTLFKLDLTELQPAMHLLQSLVLNLDTSDVEDII